AKSQEDVVFSVKDVTFNEPGIYRYTVREKAVGAAVKGVTISDKLLYIDVYITDDGNGNLRLAQTSEITSDTQKPFIISSAPNNDTAGYDVTPNADSGSEAYSTEAKADGLVNKYTSFDLYFAKQVTGNQGSRDKYFMFDVTVNNLTDGYVVNADLTNAVASPTQTPATSYKTMTNPTSITANSSGTASGSFYLQDGQYIRLKGLPEGATYTVTEHPEDYTSLAADDSSLAASPIKTITVNEEEKKFVDPTANNTDTGITGDVFTGYRNTKNGTVPTGIVLAYTPVVIIGVLALAGIIFLAYKRKSE
ncbi:MAG: hypothetical protein IJ080_02190, partial [Oscillospiraceae bacterium]|nr:hypothetical protein [Oscillospiraceae bacterium]